MLLQLSRGRTQAKVNNMISDWYFSIHAEKKFCKNFFFFEDFNVFSTKNRVYF